MYRFSIGSGNGVFYGYGGAERIKHEIKHLPPFWSINVWELNPDGTTKRRCELSEFAEDDA